MLLFYFALVAKKDWYTWEKKKRLFHLNLLNFRGFFPHFKFKPIKSAKLVV